jgi:hypothetical protein
MSTITTEFRAPAARSTALRAADGVIAGYIHTLARSAAPAEPAPRNAGRLASPSYHCSSARAARAGSRRRPALRRVPLPA